MALLRKGAQRHTELPSLLNRLPCISTPILLSVLRGFLLVAHQMAPEVSLHWHALSEHPISGQYLMVVAVPDLANPLAFPAQTLDCHTGDSLALRNNNSRRIRPKSLWNLQPSPH